MLLLLTNLSIGVPIFDKSLEVGAFRSRAEQRTMYVAWDMKILVNATTVKLYF